MPRYINEFPTTKTPEQIGAITNQYLTAEGFGLKDYDGGIQVWQKGIGLVAAPQFVLVLVGSGTVRVEAWIKLSVLPGVYGDEMNLDGFVGIAVKKPLKKRVEELVRRLAG